MFFPGTGGGPVQTVIKIVETRVVAVPDIVPGKSGTTGASASGTYGASSLDIEERTLTLGEQNRTVVLGTQDRTVTVGTENRTVVAPAS
jgi:hypothetical protein